MSSAAVRLSSAGATSRHVQLPSCPSALSAVYCEWEWHRGTTPAASRGLGLLFTSERDGSAHIYRVHLDGSGLERLTDDPAYDDQAVLSPDGKTLAFVSSRGPGRAHIWLLDLASRRAHLLTDNHWEDGTPIWFSEPLGKLVSSDASHR